MSAHSSVRKQRTDKEFVASCIMQWGDTQDTYSSIKAPPWQNLASDLDSEEYDSIHQSADDLIEDTFPETPTKQDVDSFKDQIVDFVNSQMAFTRTINGSNRKFAKIMQTCLWNLPD